MKTHNSSVEFASISEMLSDQASESLWGKALSALAQFKISSSVALALVLFFAVSAGSITLVAYTEMTNSGLAHDNATTISQAGNAHNGKVLGMASYGYNQPNCNRENCLNHTLIGFERGGWQVQINYQLQPGVVGVIKVNSWPFMDNVRGSGSGLTGYDLEPGEDYNFILYRKNGRRLTKLVSLNLTAPEKPGRNVECPLRPIRQGCTLDYSQDECGVEVCEVNQTCEYPAPPQHCTYVPGMNFNPETQCGLELKCNNSNPSYGYMGHLTFKENTNAPITNPIPADSAMATLANVEVVSEIVMDVGSFSHQINSITFEAKPNEALQNIENAYLYNGPILLAKAKVLGRIYCTMGSSCPSSSEMVFDLNPPLNIAMGKNSVLTIKGDVAGSASGSIALRPITYSIVPGTTYPTGSGGLRSWWSQSIAFTPSRGPVCPTIDIMCRSGERVIWDPPTRENSCRLPRCVSTLENAKLAITAPVANATLSNNSNQVIAWEASNNIARVSITAEAQFMPTCPTNTSCAQVLPQYLIVKFTNNPGRYEWKVGQYLGGDSMPGGKYKLRIDGYTTTGELLISDSREIALGSFIPTTSESGLSISNLRVLDSVLVKGQTYRFKWESNGIEKMYIWLFKKSSGNQVVYWISDVAKNNNYFDWTVPTSLADGNDYYARVTGYANGGDAGKVESQTFVIQSGVATCLPPPPIACRENQTTVWREENGCRVSGGCVDLHPTTPPLPPIVNTPNTSTSTLGGSAGVGQSQYPTYRYVKIETPSSNSWVAWREIEVYDDAGQKVAISSASATSEYRESVSARVYDGNVNTVWNSGSYYNAGITLDLGTEKKVSKIRILPANYPSPASTTHYLRGKLASDTSFKDITIFGGSIKDNEWLEYKLEKK